MFSMFITFLFGAGLGLFFGLVFLRLAHTYPRERPTARPRTRVKGKRSIPRAAATEWVPQVVQLGPIGKHPNADTLGITHVLGQYPVCLKLDEWKEGDKAIYIPIDTIVPDTERFAWLEGHRRIKARKLRGVFSMGFVEKLECRCPEDVLRRAATGHCHLAECERFWEPGRMVAKDMGLVKYEPPIVSATHGENVDPPEGLDWPDYDLEALRRWGKILQEGERVVITEKLHGANARYVYSGGKLHVGSHHCWKAPPAVDANGVRIEQPNVWWQVAEQMQLASKLSEYPDYMFYGEVYGYVQDLRYGHKPGEVSLRIFDIRDEQGNFLSWTRVEAICRVLGLDTVPVLYVGPWSDTYKALADGTTTLDGGHIREGIVISAERFSEIGRVKLKHIGEGYHLRKEGVSPIMAPRANGVSSEAQAATANAG